MSKGMTASIAAAFGAVAVCAAVAIGGGSDPSIESETVGTLPPATVLTPTSTRQVEPPKRPEIDAEAVTRQLAESFSVLRGASAASDGQSSEAKAIADGGQTVFVRVQQQGLCVAAAGGGGACGSFDAATTQPTILHTAGWKDGVAVETVTGVVPDTVRAVRITGGDGSPQTIAVRQNVFSADIVGRTRALTWVMNDGSSIRQLP